MARSSPVSTEINRGDRLFVLALRWVGLALILTLGGLCAQLLLLSMPAIQKFGWAIFYGTEWNPTTEVFGALPFLHGTLLTSFLALVFSVPVSIGIALLLSELLPKKVAAVVGFLVEMLAAIPSVVYGLWGLFVLVPWLRADIEPFISEKLGFIPIFSGPAYGVGVLAASLILAVMITPTIASISREVFRAVPSAQREAALSLGATRWEMIRISVLASSVPGVFGACVLGLGRALGETMAVTMVIGNRNAIADSILAPAQTMASVIANEYAEATGSMHLSSLASIGLTLFIVTMLINFGARLVVNRFRRGLA